MISHFFTRLIIESLYKWYDHLFWLSSVRSCQYELCFVPNLYLFRNREEEINPRKTPPKQNDASYSNRPMWTTFRDYINNATNFCCLEIDSCIKLQLLIFWMTRWDRLESIYIFWNSLDERRVLYRTFETLCDIVSFFNIFSLKKHTAFVHLTIQMFRNSNKIPFKFDICIFLQFSEITCITYLKIKFRFFWKCRLLSKRSNTSEAFKLFIVSIEVRDMNLIDCFFQTFVFSWRFGNMRVYFKIRLEFIVKYTLLSQNFITKNDINHGPFQWYIRGEWDSR